jgi:predicted unusual protein kinase regulating ubiquinone biosynthesis (AarF/ABC1/UbiB family)
MPRSDEAVPQGRVRRTMPLAGFSARAAAGRLVAGLRERTGGEGAVDRFHGRTAERYTELLGHSKGALMKAGQILSMIDPDALGSGGFAPYQRALTQLQSDAPPMHPALVRQVLTDELGLATEHFREISEEPLAAASVGQVHHAVLRDGREVAVKIQYPGVAQAIRDDLANTELLATVLRFATAASGIPIDIRGVAREATARITEEVDYRHEATMINAFGELYRGHPFIRVPDVVAEASSDRVLTMTHLDGMGWAAAQHADQDLKNTWAEVIIRFLNGNYRHANLVQADPHPGNYRFGADGSVGFVDFGCVQICPERQRWLFVALMRAGIEERVEDFRENMIQLGLIEADSPLGTDDLTRWASDLTHEINMPQPVTYTPGAITRNMHGMFGTEEFLPLAHMTVTPQFVFLPRIQIAFAHLAAAMRATLPVRAILEDMDGVAEPTTELGKLHHAWVRERGLPGALDHHDQL